MALVDVAREEVRARELVAAVLALVRPVAGVCGGERVSITITLVRGGEMDGWMGGRQEEGKDGEANWRWASVPGPGDGRGINQLIPPHTPPRTQIASTPHRSAPEGTTKPQRNGNDGMGLTGAHMPRDMLRPRERRLAHGALVVPAH
ncbi:hypothetical protein B0H11DRAFT_499048 [Mycena galericulata]|nr:hypothetical protein B0H11DRAFT_499048 [Mycena galericulata]